MIDNCRFTKQPMWELTMAKLSGGRPGFREWIDKQPDPKWGLMPLTHVTKGLIAEDIIRSGNVDVSICTVFNEPLAYFFYGRPSYRVKGDGPIKLEGACPFCFIFDGALIRDARAINALDSGAFSNRLFKHYMMEEMNIEDFGLENDVTRPNRVIGAVFSSLKKYFEGDLKNATALRDQANA